jgi:hypothetical protein
MVVLRLAEYPSVVRLPSNASAPSASLDFTTDSVDDNVCAVTARDTTHAVPNFQGGIDDFIKSERLRLLGFRMIGRA